MGSLPPWLVEVAKLAGGAAAGYVLSVFFGVNKIRLDLAYLKGQLSQVMQRLGKVDKLEERHAILERDHDKTRRDVDAAHAGLRELRVAPPSVQ
jgi:Tfp pilus assembly protein PilN